MSKTMSKTEAAMNTIKWLVEAEHTGGASDNHSCSRGAWSDPVDGFEHVCDAETEEAAISQAYDQLEGIVVAYAGADSDHPASCRRRLIAGSGRWWNSVTLHAVPLACAEDQEWRTRYLEAEDDERAALVARIAAGQPAWPDEAAVN